MQGNGAYNSTAVVQMTLVDYTRELLKNNIHRLRPSSPNTIRIADLGASEGRNSMALLATVLELLQEFLPASQSREFIVYHEDLPANDFNSLLNTINSTLSYLHNRPNVYASVISKSFYERLVPAESLDVVVSFISLHWLSSIPAPVPGNNMTMSQVTRDAYPGIYKLWKDKAHEDLVKFLRLRAIELSDHGVMCLTMAGYTNSIVHNAWVSVIPRALQQLVTMGLLSQTSLDKMTIGGYIRTCDEIKLAAAQVPELVLHECKDIDMPLLVGSAQNAAAFMVATTTPSIVDVMTKEEVENSSFHTTFAVKLEEEFSRLITVDGVTKPIYACLECRYIYCAFTRQPRLAARF
ncbi:benzoate carboxyl methyltransferase-like [Thraustotheca clavata]|uniref:Benzoate carboxyl methyltransferase-like n=1 Tax=Thraustotheca clavata TaxID=74557 RepID=A0A1W0A7J2_9STRA|nr:benzoate carboxyl methyltransferase-like [Thraustotheca clavata]